MAIKKYANGSWVSASYRKYGTETDTITTLPATVIGDGTPISSYIIKGNMEQNGTPTPENPIMPNGCGERTENLAEWVIEKATISDSGIIASNSSFNMIVAKVVEGKTYTITTSSSSGFVYGFFSAFPTIYSQSYNNIRFVGQRTFTAPIDGYIAFRVVLNDTLFMLTEGSTAPASYIPYGYKLPITLGRTTTNIYLGEVQSTRRIKKLVLTGEEGWLISSSWKGTTTSVFYFNDYTIHAGEYNVRIVYSDRFLASTRDELYNGDSDMSARTGTNSITFRVSDSIATTLTDWTQYLAQQYANGTPVTIWYVLAEPTTGIVNEPIRKIGDYVDSVSGTNLATSGTAQEFDVGTTLKPSEVDMTYHGWHEHGDTKYST